jgi:hypothetical protein
MTTKMTKQLLDLAKRFANHGHKHNFITGFTKIPLEDTNLQIRVYFSDQLENGCCVYFSFISDYQKSIEIQNWSKSITFGYMMTTSEFNQIIEASTKKILELESMEVVIDEENEQIKAKINDLQGQLLDLTKKLKS